MTIRPMDDWGRRWLREAYRLAAGLSDDPNTRNGAIILEGGKVLSRGANCFPLKIAVVPQRQTPERKHTYMLHAEEHAILELAKSPDAVGNNTVMVCPWAACTRCARQIVAVGLSAIFVHKQAHDRTPERWRAEIEQAQELLREANVQYYMLDGEVGKATHRMDGHDWEP